MTMNAPLRLGSIAVLGGLAACAGVRLSGYAPEQEAAMEAAGRCEPYSVFPSTGPGRARESTPEQREVVHYSDLGPADVDVSSYPAAQKENYKIYARVCSRCHTLARSINAPAVSRAYWRFYLWSMRARAHSPANTAITKAEAAAILDFLEFDSQERKVKGKKEFSKLTEELKCRFTPLLEERLRAFQESGQKLLR